MKKYLICSDVHGSEPSFKKIYDYFKKNNFDELLILGDLLYHGPRNDLPEGYHPKGVIPLANELKDKITMVKGNCEAEVDQMVLDFHIYNKKKLVIRGKNVYLVHGNHLDKEHNNYQEGDIVFYGHTHVSKYEMINGVKYINPGSTTIPKENTKKSFITLIDNRITLRDIDGNYIATYGFDKNKEKSCGAVIYKEENGEKLFLVEHMNGGHYSIVKGHIEDNETEVQTALREIKEETNLDVELDTNFRVVNTYSPYPDCTKDVVFFIAKAISNDIKVQECEVRDILFLPIDKAIDIMTYESDKETLRKAKEYLK